MPTWRGVSMFHKLSQYTISSPSQISILYLQKIRSTKPRKWMGDISKKKIDQAHIQIKDRFIDISKFTLTN
jgi:hypothetical protein